MKPDSPHPLPQTPLPEHCCPLCGQPNACAAARTGSFEQPCWCTEGQFPAALLQRVPLHLSGRACICRACAEAGAT